MMLDTVIFIALVMLAVIAVIRRPDWTAGSLLTILILSIIITHHMHDRAAIIWWMLNFEAVLALCMTFAWGKWVSRRAQLIIGLSLVKSQLLFILHAPGLHDLAQWQAMMVANNALLVAQIMIAGGMMDAVITWFDRIDPANARDRDKRANCVAG